MSGGGLPKFRRRLAHSPRELRPMGVVLPLILQHVGCGMGNVRHRYRSRIILLKQGDPLLQIAPTIGNNLTWWARAWDGIRQRLGDALLVRLLHRHHRDEVEVGQSQRTHRERNFVKWDADDSKQFGGTDLQRVVDEPRPTVVVREGSCELSVSQTQYPRPHGGGTRGGGK